MHRLGMSVAALVLYCHVLGLPVHTVIMADPKKSSCDFVKGFRKFGDQCCFFDSIQTVTQVAL
jgi:hypothetical protein